MQTALARQRRKTLTTLEPLDEYSIYLARESGHLLRRPNHFKLIDLFAGAGGMTLGFSKAFGHSFIPVWANDFDEGAVATYNANFGDHAICGDIVEILESNHFRIPRADVVIGGPPCQGFSLLNKQRKADPRKQLWRPFLEIVRRSKASVFVMENVPQLLGSREHQEILCTAESMGFKLAYGKLCAADYGVPQKRWRALIFGCKYKDPRHVFPPKRTHFDPNNGRKAFSQPTLFEQADRKMHLQLEPWKTVRDAIGDLPKPTGTAVLPAPAPFDLHFGRTPTHLSLQRYRAIPKEGMNRFDLQRRALDLTPACWIRKTEGGTDLFGRLWWDKPAFTIRTEFFKPEKGRYLHPVQHRPITHREAARLQSFPDSFTFRGRKIDIAKQIGNAVPPRLAARIADCVYALLTAG